MLAALFCSNLKQKGFWRGNLPHPPPWGSTSQLKRTEVLVGNFEKNP